MITFLIADDHPLTLLGTKNYIECLGYTVIDTARNGIVALNLIKLHLPEFVVLDINMPGMDGLDILAKIKEESIPCKVILLTMHKEESAYKKALSLGVNGYLLKEHANEELEICIKEVKNNNNYFSSYLNNNLIVDIPNNDSIFNKLSLSERKIIELIGLQKTTKQIAELLFLSEKTIEGYRSNIIEKLGLPKEKNALLMFAVKHFNKE